MNRMTKILTGLLLMGAFVFSGIGQGIGTVSAAEKDITVTVLLYSGRPDPVYTLDDQDLIEKLKTVIAEAERVVNFDKQSVIPSILGYKGILISNPEKREGLPAGLALHQGIIEVRGEQQRFLVDKDEALESQLLDEAIRKGVLDDVIVKRIHREP